MRSGFFASFLLLASGLAARPAEIELTGLVEIGGCRMACFRLSTDGENIVLRKGDTVQGVTLRELNARHGWAQFDIKGQLVRARLANFCAPQSAAPTHQGETPASRRRLRGSVLIGSDSRLAPTERQGQRDGSSTGSAPLSALGFFGRAQVQPAAPGNNEAASSENSSSGQPTETSADPVNNEDSSASPSPTPQDSVTDRRRAYEAALESDPTYQEGERIKMLYGLQGFLAWDLARGQASLEGK